ncbi:MAG: hypothetical protein LBK26_00920, partial [Rickettsiales bacterium]|nr:hypothetical protein [Rickettsiales bacterium]
GSGEHSDAVTTADDQFLKNGGKKVELVEGTRAEQMVEERCSEFAVELVDGTVAENTAKNQTTEDLVEERCSESAEQMVEGICLEFAEEEKPELMMLENTEIKDTAPAELSGNIYNKSRTVGDSLQPEEKFYGIYAATECVFRNFLDMDLLINELSELDFINVEHLEFHRDEDLLKMNGFYDLRSDKISIRYFPRTMPNDNTNVYNARLPFVLIHELKHYLDLHFHLKQNFDARQLILANLNEEFVARVSELLLARRIAIQSDNYMSAFRRLADRGGDHDMILGKLSPPDLFYKYRNWLDKNRAALCDTLSTAEADIIVSTAISMFHPDAIRQYQKNLPSIITASSVQNRHQEKLFTKGMVSFKTVADYQKYISDIWIFGGQNILDLCSPLVRAKVTAFENEFWTTAMKSKKLSELAGLYQNQLNMIIQFQTKGQKL